MPLDRLPEQRNKGKLGADDQRAVGDGRRLAAADLEGDHSAESTHLRGCERVLRMRFQSRVNHARDRRMLLQPGGNRGRILAVPLHPDRECLDAAQRQETIEGRGCRAGGVLEKFEPLIERVVI